MKCPNCSQHISKDSDFCMNCGYKIEKNSHSMKAILCVAGIIIFAILIVLGIGIQKKSLQSPIEGVSQKVYMQGMEYLEMMKSASVRKTTIAQIKNWNDKEMKDIYKYIEGVDFKIDYGKKPTGEEQYFADLILKFWESWVICYGHESIIAGYEDNEDSGIQMLTSMYKGIVSDFKDGISEAEDILKKAEDYTDMMEAYKVLEDIWKGEDE